MRIGKVALQVLGPGGVTISSLYRNTDDLMQFIFSVFSSVDSFE